MGLRRMKGWKARLRQAGWGDENRLVHLKTASSGGLKALQLKWSNRTGLVAD